MNLDLDTAGVPTSGDPSDSVFMQFRPSNYEFPNGLASVTVLMPWGFKFSEIRKYVTAVYPHIQLYDLYHNERRIYDEETPVDNFMYGPGTTWIIISRKPATPPPPAQQQQQQ